MCISWIGPGATHPSRTCYPQPFGTRCFAYIGHKATHAAQVERTLARIGWEHAEPVLCAARVSDYPPPTRNTSLQRASGDGIGSPCGTTSAWM